MSWKAVQNQTKEKDNGTKRIEFSKSDYKKNNKKVRERERGKKWNPRKVGWEAYDIIVLEADGIRGPAEAKDEEFVERISYDAVYFFLLRESRE